MSDEYQQRLQAQKNQYQTGAEIHELPQIFHYWSHKFLRPRMEAVFNVTSVRDFYAKPFASRLEAALGQIKFVSIGSGDCNSEVEITEYLLSLGHRNFSFICLEVSDTLIREAKSKVRAKGLDSHVHVINFDVNRETLDFPVHGFMAHHSLHHIMELERLFSMIDACLDPSGCFLTMDMIGRNGHMRWPETLGFIDALWNVIDDSKKFSHQFREYHPKFVNHDCSNEGFEGIRAQDIMPLLVSRFSFTHFCAVGGLIDIFIDRNYGPNFNVTNPIDICFIDFVEELNSNLIKLGFVKPTMLYAAMTKKDPAVKPRIIGSLTPEFCVRVAFGISGDGMIPVKRL
jgi:SAM-dependent methyltransferase